jgi:hypothetical protein
MNRKEMGEEAWSEYQKFRNREKTKRWKARNILAVIDWRRRTKEKLIAYKGGKCELCGYNKNCPSAYDFHHRDPKKKEFGIGQKGITRSLEKLKKEADKCQLLCRNCHAEVHQEDYKKEREATKARHVIYLKKSGNKVVKRDELKTKAIEKTKSESEKPAKIQKVCEQCGKTFNETKEGQKYCSIKCANIDHRKVIRPDRDVLSKLLWEKPTEQIGKFYGVSGKAVEKWAKIYQLEKPPRGYWIKKKFGKI